MAAAFFVNSLGVQVVEVTWSATNVNQWHVGESLQIFRQVSWDVMDVSTWEMLPWQWPFSQQVGAGAEHTTFNQFVKDLS